MGAFTNKGPRRLSPNAVKDFHFGMMLKETSLTAREVDPLLKDLTEKKKNFRHSVVSLAAELKDVRGRLASQAESFARETLTRQAAEAKARSMEDVICQLQRRLEEKNGQLQVSKSDTEQYLKELDNLRSQLSVAQATADESTASAQSMQFQCLAMLRELEEKSSSLKAHENRVTMLGEQLDHLQKDLEAREASQKQLKDEVLKIEEGIMLAVTKAGVFKDQELMKILEEDILKDFGSIKKHLNAKDEEISRLRDEIGVMSAQWKLKTKELESQLEKHRRSDQEIKKRVLKLEFCLQEARSQVRKLQRVLDNSSILCGREKRQSSEGTERSIGHETADGRQQH
ncbi:nuclear envelope-associated protein 2-like isoform X2 [Magnolia sinica]|uniref:nuclear envelope-associated protein 2-like isoform X2 n=1 Tax=Magnolia sinica TaxID=86752 RepID=UPI002658CE61|nr:nuclear envelope-associated protein 2-like isoform X2 [Magnolia sinica]